MSFRIHLSFLYSAFPLGTYGCFLSGFWGSELLIVTYAWQAFYRRSQLHRPLSHFIKGGLDYMMWASDTWQRWPMPLLDRRLGGLRGFLWHEPSNRLWRRLSGISSPKWRAYGMDDAHATVGQLHDKLNIKSPWYHWNLISSLLRRI